MRLLRELRDLRIPVDVVVVGQSYAEEWAGGSRQRRSCGALARSRHGGLMSEQADLAKKLLDLAREEGGQRAYYFGKAPG